MSISPPSDLILDVMKAADPARLQAASARLRNMAAARTAIAAAGTGERGGFKMPSASDPAGSGGRINAPGPRPVSGARDLLPASVRAGAASVDGAHRAAQGSGTASADALRKGYAALEAVVIENMLDGMLKGGSSGSVFGSGLAGEYWKSMMAQAVAGQVARRGGMGLAQALLRRAGGPDGITGAARALGLSQRMDREFLATLDAATESRLDKGEENS